MAQVTFQILDGPDRGKLFREIDTPLTIGREEGNAVLLKDERISRYHVKVQEDQGQVVLTDLDSTNGTRVNNETVQLSILRPGDRITVGRSTLLFGAPEEIQEEFAASSPSVAEEGSSDSSSSAHTRYGRRQTDRAPTEGPGDDMGFELEPNFTEKPEEGDEADAARFRSPPDVPQRLTPAQAAQFSELLLYLHQRLNAACDHAHTDEAGEVIHLPSWAWQQILNVEWDLARYLYRIGRPD